MAVAGLLAADSAGLPDKDLDRGRKIYLSKCAKCHELYEPKTYSQKDWDEWMVKMARTSKLRLEQYDLAKRYADHLRQTTKPEGPK